MFLLLISYIYILAHIGGASTVLVPSYTRICTIFSVKSAHSIQMILFCVEHYKATGVTGVIKTYICAIICPSYAPTLVFRAVMLLHKLKELCANSFKNYSNVGVFVMELIVEPHANKMFPSTAFYRFTKPQFVLCIHLRISENLRA